MLQRGAAALLCLALSVAFVEAQFTLGRSCFCKGPEGEAVDECPCDGEASIDDFNNRRVFPILQRLLQKDFFRFYKVNMAKTCPFWPDERQCGLNKCGIDDCDHEVPPALKVSRVVSMGGSPSSTSLAEAKDADDKPGCKQTISNQFDPLDASLSDDNQAQLQHMDMHKFCDYEDSSDARYYDMAKNPERYTGYSGNSAWKVWKAIYEENCFKPENNSGRYSSYYSATPFHSDLCLEKKVFQRLMSGMHSAISISISSHNYKPAPAGFGSGTWFRNNKMFEKAFGTSVSAEGPERLKNVYFVYLLELRALMKAAPYLQQELFFTGNEEEDRETRKLVENLMEVVNSYRHQFDETEMFTGVESHARELREEFRQHFVNISRIMDCVECDKCRLWGKLQTHGMGTALKILFSDLPSSLFKSSEGLKCEFTRNELVALFQSFGRYASSIREVEEFRKEATGDTYRRIEL
ncbi:hypothetical protein QR680_008866 [Steinernema hermaphroditum]|uniref:Endoplasmic reticulum oxidoreductin-1 n=1 Tax=Steinernema hermaphroditum TaxID=289476 RepID=A0AA39IJL7_9BILA|nr:hypothetical protein QR680_008866 [Steinernema hermaphroditum]